MDRTKVQVVDVPDEDIDEDIGTLLVASWSGNYILDVEHIYIGGR